MDDLDINYLREILEYEEHTGKFIWLKSRTNSIKVGDIAGSKNKNGYVVISIDDRRYLAHRLAWFYVYGVWPKKLIDHKNGKPPNNKIINLRQANHTTNGQNSKFRKNNTSGYKGVVFRKDINKYHARIRVFGKDINLGFYDTAIDASNAYNAASIKYFGEFVRSSI